MIRKATAADASRLAEILIFAKRTAYRPIFQNDAVSFNEMQVLDLALSYRNMPEMLEEVYVYDDGIVKGMMKWDGNLSDGPKSIWMLKELYVDPFFQKQGVGRNLMLNFLSSASEHQASEACLWVLEKNAVARRFYEAMGFQFNGVRKLEPGTTQYLFKYVKEL